MKTKLLTINRFRRKKSPLPALLAGAIGSLSLPAAADSPYILGPGNTGTSLNSIAAGSNNNLGNSTSGGSIAVGSWNIFDSAYGAAAFGTLNKVYGAYTLTAGYSNTTSGYVSSALGYLNTVSAGADCGLAAGMLNIAEAPYSMALGNSLTARSKNSFVVGSWNTALPGETYFQMENGVNKEYTYSDAKTLWRGTDSLFVVGNGTASNARSNALVVRKNGAVDIPTGPLTVNGRTVVLNNPGSVGTAWGPDTTATGAQSFATGIYSQAGADFAVALGYDNDATAKWAFAAGSQSKATNQGSIALGYAVQAIGQNALATGDWTEARGVDSFASGSGTRSYGAASFAGGRGAEAGLDKKNGWEDPGGYSFAFGYYTNASNTGSVAMGLYPSASGYAATAFGQGSDALGSWSLAAGYEAIAKQSDTIAMGRYARAYSMGATAIGYGVDAWRIGQTVVGRLSAAPGDWEKEPGAKNSKGQNLEEDAMVLKPSTVLADTDEVFVVGGGLVTDSGSVIRKNALIVQGNGNTSITGTLKVGNATMTSTSGGSPVFTQPVILQGSAIVNDIPMYGGN